MNTRMAQRSDPTETKPRPKAVFPGTGGHIAIGARLKQIRTANEMTIQTLSARAQVGRSTISKIENGQLSPTFDILQRLARGLGTDLATFFNVDTQPSPLGRRSLTRSGQGRKVENEQYLYEGLATDLSHKQIFPLLTTIKSRNFSEFDDWIRHDGEEFLYVLRGEILFLTELYEPSHMQVGDSIYIDSRMGHACISLGSENAQVLWVCTQVSLDL